MMGAEVNDAINGVSIGCGLGLLTRGLVGLNVMIFYHAVSKFASESVKHHRQRQIAIEWLIIRK